MNRTRNALTLVEVLVVIFIIGILMGLLIPAVNSVHTPRRRSQCSINLKNLSLAAIQYENANEQFPGFVNDFGVFGADGLLSDPSDDRVDSATLAKHRKIGTWAVSLFPWLDAQPTYEHWTVDRFPIVSGGSRKYPLTSGRAGEGYTQLSSPNLSIMQCPSSPIDFASNGANSYIANVNVFNSKLVARWPGDLDGTRMSTIDPPVRWDDFKDGQGNTILFTESIHAMPWHRSGFSDLEDLIFTESPDEVFYPTACRFTNGLVSHEVDWENGDKPKVIHRINGPVAGRDPLSVVMTANNAADLATPSSGHAAGVNVSMADGGTRFITETIDMKIWNALLTPAGREAISADAF